MTPPKKKIRVLLADDHFVVRLGLAATLNNESDMEVAGEATDAEAAVESCIRLKPDVAIIDLHLPGRDGIAAMLDILQANPAARVLILSVHEGDENILRAMESGAMGYLSKSAPHDEILAAVRAAAQGTPHLSPELSEKLARRRERPDLTPRELAVLKLVARGSLNKEIAADLGIAEITVKQYVSSILRKLGVLDRTQAATAAIARGIVRIE